MRKMMIALVVIALVGVGAALARPSDAAPPAGGRWQVIQGAPQPILLDSSTGNTWMLCEVVIDSIDASHKWCRVDRSDSTTVHAR